MITNNDFSVQEAKENSTSLIKVYKIELSKKSFSKRVEELLEQKKNDFNSKKHENASILPFAFMEKKYRVQLEKEILQEKQQQVVNHVSQHHQGKIIRKPQINNTLEIKKNNEDFIYFEIEIEVLPKVELPNFNKIELDHFVIKISEDTIDKSLNSIATEYDATETDEKNKKIKELDKITVSITMKDAKKDIVYYQNPQLKFNILSKEIDETFEKHFIGLKKGEAKSFEISFPKNVGFIKSVAGKTVLVQAEILHVQHYSRTMSDQDVVSKYNCNSIQELRYRIASLLRSEYQKEIYAINQAVLFKKLKSQLKFDVPPSLLKSEMERLGQVKKGLMNLRNNKKAGHDNAIDKYLDTLLSKDYNLQEDAKSRVRVSLVLAECARTHNITVPQKEFEEYVKQEMNKYTSMQDKQKVLDECHKNKEMWMAFKIEQKAMAYVIERKVSLREKIVTTQEVGEFIDKSKQSVLTYF